MEGFLNDLRQSVRMFRRNPGFTLAAIAALTLGVGANTAIFTIVNAVLLKPIPFPDRDRLVMVIGTSPQGMYAAASPLKFAHWRRQGDAIQEVSAFNNGMVSLTGVERPEQLASANVSADYFHLFGAPVVRGRTFAADEDRPGGARVVMISEGLWKRRFGGDPHIVGTAISVNDEPTTVVGVVGSAFDVSEFGRQPDVWLPLQLDPDSRNQAHILRVAARLKPGATLEQAKARLQLSAADFKARFPDTLGPEESFSAVPFQEAFVEEARQSLMVLAAAVAFVLLIACANVASLLLARATGRVREIAIRCAIGASRMRIVRQLLTESVLLSFTAGVVGLGLGFVAIRALLSVNTAGLPRLGEQGSAVGIDWRVMSFAVVMATATGVAFGLFPALDASRADLNVDLKDGSRSSSAGPNQARSLLVVAEVALTVILLVGSSLLIRTSIALRHVDPGFDPHHVLTMQMSLTRSRFLQSSRVEQAVREGVARLRALPGVDNAAATCSIPLERAYFLPFAIVGRPLPGGRPLLATVGWTSASPEYFEVFRIPIRRGRTFTDRDDAAAPPVVVINETMARRYWPDGADPLNDRLVIGKGAMREFDGEPARQIIGIVADSRDSSLNSDPGSKMFVPQAQLPDAVNALVIGLAPVVWVVRTRGEPHALAGPAQEQLRQATGLPISAVRTMDEVMAKSTSREQFNTMLMSAFAASALLLAAIGIYGLMAYSVAQRTREIGIRLALGAESTTVKRMVVFQGMRLAIAGVVIGIASAVGLSRFIAGFLFGVGALDPLVFVSIPLLLAAVAWAAVSIPAARASRVDPAVALRAQ
jgi:predicted permease